MNTPFVYFRDNIIGLHEMNTNSTRYISEGIERFYERGYTDKAIYIAMVLSKEKLLHAFDIHNPNSKFTMHTNGSRGFNYKYAIRYAFKVIESELDDAVRRLERQNY
ncbi:hypothetical protein [Priestia aryabhattai]